SKRDWSADVCSSDLQTGVELLVDDFRGGETALQKIFDAKPEVFAHNIETVPRLMKIIRPAFRYEKSLAALTSARDAGLVTKSNLILGMGVTSEDIEDTIIELINTGTHIITITQYQWPSPPQHPVERCVKPTEFLRLRDFAYERGAAAVMSGPLVRSSYRSGKLYVEAMRFLGRDIPEQFNHLVENADTPARQEAETVAERFADPNDDVAAIPA